MTDVVDLASYRARRRPGLLREQLSQSVESLRGNFGLPPTPNAGKVIGDEVRFTDGRIGRVDQHLFTKHGLMLIVRVNGWAVSVMAQNVEPVRRA